jgi:hypothetical protein
MDFDKLNKYLTPIVDNPSSKKWTILKLERFAPTTASPSALFVDSNSALIPKRPIREPSEFRDCLKHALRPLFKTVVYVKFHDGALWAAIDMLSIGMAKQKTTIFLVHYPHAEFVFVSAIKNRAVQESLHDALCDVFQCEQVRVINCNGRDLTSLADMALHPLSQGSFGAYRLYTTILDSNLFDDEDEKLDQRRRARAMDKADTDVANSGAGAIVSPSKAKRFQTAGGLGVVIDESKGKQESTASSGVLTKEQREKLTSGTSALNEIKLVIDHDLEWNGQSIKFACTLVVRGSNVIHGIRSLSEKGLVNQGESASEIVADASNVIRDAFVANSEKERKKSKRGKRAAATDDAEGIGGENQEQKMVRTVAVKCF